jgi:selenocysteine lyase/cysteine desulfurase
MTAPPGAGLAGSRAAGQPARQEEFLAAYPAYRRTAVLDRLRAGEYGYLDAQAQVYLDYTGAGLPARAQVAAHADRLAGGCFGNPHSENPTSAASTELIERARRRVLEHFSAPPDEYAAIFTANATAACRIVAEAYPFGPRSRLVVTCDNHNSVNGIREFARARGAATEYVPFGPPGLRVSDEAVTAALDRPGPAVATAAATAVRSGVAPWAGRGPRARRQRALARKWAQDPRRSVAGLAGGPPQRRRGLFAYPAQSNFTGVQHPLGWIETAHDRGYDVLLDAAAFVPANPLDLSVVKPDFVPVSWYKVFGYPTGVGCLIARREALARLWRPWFSGGTINAVSVQGDWHVLAGDEARFEDGTLNFLNIPDLEFGLSWVSSVGVDVIHERVRCLTAWMLGRLAALRHSGGEPMALIYGPSGPGGRGGTIAFNLLDPHGRIVDERAVARDTAAAGISVRTGCFCNPGAGEGAFGITRDHVVRAFRDRARTVDEYLESLGLPSGGAIRASVGIASNLADVERFLSFIEETYRDRPAEAAGLAPRLRC